MLNNFIFRLPARDQLIENEGKQWELIFIFRNFNIALLLYILLFRNISIYYLVVELKF
jgi:hypothetical protein